MNDDFESELRERLGKAVPTPPETPDRAAEARGYSRRVRRTRAVLVVGAAAAVVAAIVVVPSVLASSDNTAGPDINTPAAKPSLVLPPLAHPNVCAIPRFRQPAPEHGVVLAGAVLARICPINTGTVDWSAPAEPLVTAVDALATLLNHLPKTSPSTCTPKPGLQYTVTFQYADGYTVAVNGEAGNCDTVSTGPVLRAGGTTLLRAYLNRLHDQRARYSPAQRQMTPLTCPLDPHAASPVLVEGRGPGLARAIACAYPVPAGPTTIASGSLTARQVEQLNADLATHATRQPTDTPAIHSCQARRGGGVLLSINGQNSWGDRIQLTAQCSVYTFMDRNGIWYWTPSKQTAGMLRSVLHPIPEATGQISGKLLGVGGPPPGLTFHWAGTITLRSGGTLYHFSAGDDGRFDASVPPGRYWVVGYSPSYNDGKTPCHPVHPFVTVRARQAVRVNVFCQMK